MSKRKYRGTILRSCIAAGAIAFQSNGHWQIEGPALMGIWTTMGISIARISEKSEINK
jgi:hypothetical protein